MLSVIIGILGGLFICLKPAPKKKEEKEKQRIWRRGEIIRGRERVEFIRSLHKKYGKKIDEELFFRRFYHVHLSKKHTKRGDIYYFTPEKGCSKKQRSWLKSGFSVDTTEWFEHNDGIRNYMAQQDEVARSIMREQERLHMLAHERALDYFDKMSTGIEFGGFNTDLNLNPSMLYQVEQQMYQNLCTPAQDYPKTFEPFNSPLGDSSFPPPSFDYSQPDSSFNSFGGGFGF